MAASCYGVAAAISCGSPVTRRAAGLNKFFGPTNYAMLPAKRVAKFRVRSMAEEDDQIKEPAVVPPKPTTPPKPKVSTGFSDVLAFSGPGPERINGRLAMIGFVAAIGMEIANGQDIFAQVQNGGIPWFLGTSVLLSLASLIPMFRGVTAESKSGDLMTSDAELWNGRFAMLGLVALAFTEYVKGGALV
ncbi:early light-induced protein 2, chloroplastic isoform X2 [Sesamum indicum]|uniref:Early light-induced protein 2, chloroplastic isoform X2 n=1 Tax=Sesamum indicum TaxID=4182 RepID=A0A6I9U282_SESIN|nr:early light-induced protein 2, chloroplastic isoform X2 [Sesamum indicum]